jgi:hypothetical protein
MESMLITSISFRPAVYTLPSLPASPSSLPDELVLHILELAAPPPHVNSTLSARRQLLRQCSLVSQQFRRVAQPMLWAVLRCRKGRVGFPELAEHVRVLTLGGTYRPKLEEITEGMTRLREVVIDGWDNGEGLSEEQLGALSRCSASFSSCSSLLPLLKLIRCHP